MCIKAYMVQEKLTNRDCSLEKAFELVMKRPLVGAHDASIDAKAVAQIYVTLCKHRRDYLARIIKLTREVDKEMNARKVINPTTI